MLTPIIKEKGVTKRERYLARLAEDTFFGLWTFPNLYTDEGISKSGIGKELCDLLVVFKNKIIIFSDKDISFNSEKDIQVAWKRWFRKAIIKSCNQLYGAESWIKQYPERVFLDKKCTHQFPLSLSCIDYEIHLIAVTCNSTEPSENYWSGGSSGTLYHIFPFDTKECLERPFVIGDLYPNKSYVHVLDEFALDLLITELSTISDFACYLQEKERAIKSKEIFQAAGEEELLTHFLRGRENIKHSGRMIHPTGDLNDGAVSLTEGLWLEYQQEEEYHIYKCLYNESKFWDTLISRFSYHIITASVGRGEDLEFKDHERAVRHLASENRASRFVLSNAFMEKFNEVPSDRRSARLIFSPTDSKKLYVYLFIPRDEGQDYDNYREERANYIHAYSLVAKYLNPTAIDVVVISTEPQNSDGRSEDIFSIEYDEELSIDEKTEAKRLMKEERILNDMWKTKKNPLLDNADKQQPYRNKAAKYGRNEKCPCGSGNKYKKCCM